MNTNLLNRLTLAFCGGFAGAFLALQFKHSWFLVTMVYGLSALIGYIVADIRGFVQGLAKAIKESRPNPYVWNWKNFLLRIRTCFYAFGVVVIIGLQMMLLFALCLSKPLDLGFGDIAEIVAMIMLTVAVIMASSVFLIITSVRVGDLEHFRSACTELMPNMWIPEFIKFVAFCVMSIPKVSRRTLELIHSRKRVVFAICFGLGTCLGYFAGNAIVGGLVSLGIAWADWELFSLRLGWRQA